MRHRSNPRGFSLIELLLVVTIILIVASIAVPNLMRARRAANEASAVASLRTIASGQLAYRGSQGDFTTLSMLGQEKIVDDLLASGTKSGYQFATAGGTDPALEFTATAEPIISSGVAATGNRFFFVNQDQIIRYAIGGSADASSSPLND
ncbi:MAG: type II secretion system protein [Acidobacteriota bacterium]